MDQAEIDLNTRSLPAWNRQAVGELRIAWYPREGVGVLRSRTLLPLVNSRIRHTYVVRGECDVEIVANKKDIALIVVFTTKRATGLEPATSSLGSWHSTN